jgi:hypothetical protein
LFSSAYVQSSDVQYIAGSSSNFQQQINSLNSTLSGIVPSLYVARSGDTITSGWTNTGFIQPSFIRQSGITLSGSTDGLFSLTISGLSYQLSTTTLVCNSGLTVQNFEDNGNVVFTSDVTASKKFPIQINGREFYVETGFNNALYNLAGSVPTLDLQFAATKTLDARVTFTRGSTATYVDGVFKTLRTAASNEPRFTHNPTTGESLGLLVEEARTNLWQWSNSATNGETWNNVGTHLTLATGQLSPAGDSTAIRAADVDNATAGTFLQRTTVAPALTANTFVSYSIFVKPISAPNGTISLIVFANGTTDSITGIFTVTGTVITGTPSTSVVGTGASASASYIAYANGWYRLTLSGIPSTVTMADCRARINLGSYTRSTGTARFDWYGGQFENNAFASSYFPNAGTLGGVTRAADVASITGANFSSWYNQTEGTVFGQFLRTASTNTQQGRVFNFNDGTNANTIEIYQTGGSNPAAQITATTSQAAWITSGFTVGASTKEVIGYKLNNTGASFNGSAETTDTVCTMPIVTQARIGDRQDTARTLNGTIQRLTYWSTRLPNSTLQAITQ